MQDQRDEDVELMLQLDDDRESLYELIASNPKYYFELISTYDTLPSGHQIYLPDLLNLMQTRTKKTNELVVKFKFHDNDNWTTIGYDDNRDSYSDELIYSNFVSRVALMISLSKQPKKNIDKLQVSVQALNSLNLNHETAINRNISKLQTFLISIGRESKQELLPIINKPTQNDPYQSQIDFEPSQSDASDLFDKKPIPCTQDSYTESSASNSNMPCIKGAQSSLISEDIEKIKASYKYHKTLARGFKKIIKARSFQKIIYSSN
jgi:hypothetical protein